MAALTKRPPAPPRKPRGHGHERRSEILTAAKQLFISEGYETVTTRQLAERVGISQTGFYVYFKNKRSWRNCASRPSDSLPLAWLTSWPACRGIALLKRMLQGYMEFALGAKLNHRGAVLT